MAFLSKDLSVLTYANGFTLWHYKSSDLISVVVAPGYFNTMSDLVREGDLILVSADNAGTATVGFLAVANNSGGVVTIDQMI